MTDLTDAAGNVYEVVGAAGTVQWIPEGSLVVKHGDLIVRPKPAGGESDVLVRMYRTSRQASRGLDAEAAAAESNGLNPSYLGVGDFEAALAAERERVARLAQQSMKRRAAEHGAMTVAPWSKIEKEAT